MRLRDSGMVTSSDLNSVKGMETVIEKEKWTGILMERCLVTKKN